MERVASPEGNDENVKSGDADLACDFNWMIPSKRLYEKREMAGDDACRCRRVSGVREVARARNVSKQGAIVSAKISGDRRAERRIHSPPSTRLSVLRVIESSSHFTATLDDLPTTKTTRSPAETAFMVQSTLYTTASALCSNLKTLHLLPI